MERRTLLKIAALTAVSQRLGGVSHGSAGLLQTTGSAPYALRFFTPEENQVLDQLMEMIIPADDRSPGAHEAGTSLFADLMVSTGTESDKQRWRTGLQLLRKQAAGSSMTEALRAAAANEEHPETELDRFFVLLKQMTVEGYYTSAIGVHQELAYQGNTYLRAYPECTHEEQHTPERTQTSNSSTRDGVSG